MSKEKDTEKLLARLRTYRPDTETRDKIISEVMNYTVGERKDVKGFTGISLLFGWTDYRWARGALVAASLIIIVVFTFQQFTIINRIGNLEERMVNSNTKQVLEHQGEMVMIKSYFDEARGDSIMVADKDLKELIDSYSRLRERYARLQRLFPQSEDGDKPELYN